MLTLDRRIELTNRLCYLFVIFLIGCLTGWIYEEIFYWYTEGMLRNRGILYGPWLPIYGVGALGIYAMKPFKKNPAVLFLLSAGITGIQQLVSEGEFELMQEESTCPLEKVKTEDGWADEIMAHMIRCKHCGQIFTCVVNTWRGSEHFRKGKG